MLAFGAMWYIDILLCFKVRGLISTPEIYNLCAIREKNIQLQVGDI